MQEISPFNTPLCCMFAVEMTSLQEVKWEIGGALRAPPISPIFYHSACHFDDFFNAR